MAAPVTSITKVPMAPNWKHLDLGKAEGKDESGCIDLADNLKSQKEGETLAATSKTPKATESNLSEVELGTTSFF